MSLEIKCMSSYRRLGLQLVALVVVALIGSQATGADLELRDRIETSSQQMNDPTGFFEANSLVNKYDNKFSSDEYIVYSMRALKQIAGFDNDLHRYDKNKDLINSFARNLTYSDDLSDLKARIDPNESELLDDQSELTLIENELNQANCSRQLDALIRESGKLFSSFNSYSKSKQLSLLDYIDSFGSAPSSQLLMGHSLWVGSQQQCIQSKPMLEIHDQRDRSSQRLDTRYCVAKFRSPLWPMPPDTKSKQDRARSLAGESIKLGVCLPASCNSISILRHSDRIETLVKLVRLNQVPYSSYKLNQLFCLPDEGSPLRQFSWSAKLFISALSIWMMIVLYYSLRYEHLCIKMSLNPSKRSIYESEVSNLMKIFAFRITWGKLFESNKLPVKPFENSNEPATGIKLVDSEQESGIDSSDSESEHQKQRSANILTSLDDRTLGKHLQTGPTLRKSMSHPHEQMLSLRGSSSILSPSQSDVRGSGNREPSQAPSVDLAAVDGIKVLSMIWLISAHTLLFFIRGIVNGRDFWSILRDARFVTIMAGIFPVDSFFTVTGVLTSFLKFNKNDGSAMGKTRYWLEAFVHRYLRFMPMYLIIFWYTRDVSEYIGAGPLWDYATADTSLRSMCKRESISVPIFFQANFKSIDQHCVKPAWYLANDFQYLLMTPIFMGLIMKSSVLGYGVIFISIAFSLAMQFLTVFQSQDFKDHDALINFKPMFATYVLKDLWRLYVLPYNRIPPYLIGLFTGHLIYRLSKSVQQEREEKDERQLQSNQSIATSSQASIGSSTSEIVRGIKSASYLSVLSRHICTKVWTPLLVLISIIYLPLTTKLSTLNGSPTVEIGASLLIALMRFFWSVAIARVIYICATRYLNAKGKVLNDDSFVIRFISSPKWKPWSKIGLTVLLIQWEIISYLAQTQTSVPYMTISVLLAVVLVCIVATYSLALLIYLTIEYPLSQIEHLYLHPLLFGENR